MPTRPRTPADHLARLAARRAERDAGTVAGPITVPAGLGAWLARVAGQAAAHQANSEGGLS